MEGEVVCMLTYPALMEVEVEVSTVWLPWGSGGRMIFRTKDNRSDSRGMPDRF